MLKAPYGETQATIDIAEAWREAAKKLDIRVTAPFLLQSGNHETIGFIALVHGFGAPAGTLIATTAETLTPLTAVTTKHGYFVSLLSPENYSHFNADLFIDTLNDWGYFGINSPPSWYTGKSWS